MQPESVHDARKQIKRARASLRVLRDAVGSRAYREENRRLRDASRPLASTRDTDVVIEVLSALLEDEAFREQRTPLANLRSALRRERKALSGAVPVDAIRASLEECRTRVSQWRMPHDSLPIARAGLERIYRRGRKAFARAKERPTEARMHELRKQVKYLGAALQSLELADMPAASRVIERADAVAELLGADHDLAVLRTHIAEAESALIKKIAKRRGKLQKEALAAARPLFRRKARKCVTHILQP